MAVVVPPWEGSHAGIAKLEINSGGLTAASRPPVRGESRPDGRRGTGREACVRRPASFRLLRREEVDGEEGYEEERM